MSNTFLGNQRKVSPSLISNFKSLILGLFCYFNTNSIKCTLPLKCCRFHDVLHLWRLGLSFCTRVLNIWKPILRCQWPHPSMFFPHMMSSPDPVRMTTLFRVWRIIDLGYPVKAYFKNHTRAIKLPVPKIPTFQPVYKKMPPWQNGRYPVSESKSSIAAVWFLFVIQPTTYRDSTGYSTQP